MIPDNYAPSKDPRARELARHLRAIHGLVIRGDEGIALLRHWHDQEHQSARVVDELSAWRARLVSGEWVRHTPTRDGEVCAAQAREGGHLVFLSDEARRYLGATACAQHDAAAVVAHNDLCLTSRAEVLAWFDRAIALAKQLEAS